MRKTVILVSLAFVACATLADLCGDLEKLAADAAKVVDEIAVAVSAARAEVERVCRAGLGYDDDRCDEAETALAEVKARLAEASAILAGAREALAACRSDAPERLGKPDLRETRDELRRRLKAVRR